MTKILRLSDINTILPKVDIVGAMEEAFIQYSKGNAVVPPVAELLFENPPGDTHIKYGYIKNDDFFVVKVASGFYENAKLDISSSQGLMLLFSQKTGEPAAVLLDEGKLTDLRTAAAGAVVARNYAPFGNKSIGIMGTGVQAGLQLEYLLKEFTPTSVWVWGRSRESAVEYSKLYSNRIKVHVAKSETELAQNSNLIITTTPAETPLLRAEDIRPGSHITAIGSDTAGKQELDSEIIKMADIVVVDSLSQSKSRGEIFRAVQDGFNDYKVIELGSALSDSSLRRTTAEQITVADLTGVAVQDIMIAKAIYLS
jgi:ornithine cyclodeaminase